MTAAQGAAYCSKLSQTYGEYVGTFGGYLGGDARGGEAADLDARVAIANCQDGNYAAGGGGGTVTLASRSFSCRTGMPAA